MSVSTPLDAVLVGVLDEILAEIKTIRSMVTGRAEQQAKVEIKTSTRGADVTVTAYTQTQPSELQHTSDLAVAEYRRVMRALSDETMAAFAAEANKVR